MTQGPARDLDLSALAGLAPELAATFVSVASDVALVLDPDGTIHQVVVGSAPFVSNTDEWIGRSWSDTVTGDTRRKIDMLLNEVAASGVSRRRQVNHRTASGEDVPMAYAAIRLGEGGPVLAVGRDMRAIAAIQQRLVDAQQEMERDYWQRRQAESRYRLLFQVATDAVLVVDGDSLDVIEANRSAGEMFGRLPETLAGRPLLAGIDAVSAPSVRELLLLARMTGRAGEIRARVVRPGSPLPQLVDLSATPFRSASAGESSLLMLVRIREADAAVGDDYEDEAMSRFVELTGDAAVVTDASGRIQMANAAFLTLVQLEREAQAVGLPIQEALGDEDGRLAEMLVAVRGAGIASRDTLPVRGAHGGVRNVELSASLLAEGDQERIGFTLRPITRVAGTVAPVVEPLMSAIEQLVGRVGYELLPDLMRRASDLCERRLIEAAFQRAAGHRATAAQLLGDSEEGLVRRMQRLGLAGEALRSAGDGRDGSPPTTLN